MSPQEKQSPNSNKQPTQANLNKQPAQTDVLPPFIAEAEMVRQHLAVDDTAESWKALLELVRAEPSPPEKAAVGDVVRIELNRRYNALGQRRLDLSQGLLAVVAMARAQKPMNAIQRPTILRMLARYIDEHDVYEHIHKGTVPSGTLLPPYLTPYVRSREQDHFAIRMAEVMLPFQYDVMDKVNEMDATKSKESPRMVAPYAEEILMGAVSRRIAVRYIIACQDAQGSLVPDIKPYSQFLEAAGFEAPQNGWTEEDIRPARLFVGFIAKHMDAIRKHAEIAGEGTVDDVLIADAIECCVQSSPLAQLVGEISEQGAEILSGHLPDLRAFAGNLFEDGKFYPERMVQVAMEPLAALAPDASKADKESFQRDSKAVSEFFMDFESKRYTIKNVKNRSQYRNAFQQGMIAALADKVRQKPFAERLLKAAFIRPEDTDATSKKISSIFTGLIVRGDISQRDAFELYYLDETSSGDLLLAYKVAQLLEKHGHTALAIALQFRTLGKITDMATQSDEEFSKSLQELGSDDRAKTELSNIRRYLAESGLNVVDNWITRWWHFVDNFPVVGGALTVVAASGVITPAALLMRKGWITLRMGALNDFANSSPEKAIEKLKLQGVSEETVRLAQKEVTSLINEYNGLHLRFHLFRGGKLRSDMIAVRNAVGKEDLSAMAKAFKRYVKTPAEVARRLSNIADADAVKAAMKGAGFSDQEIADAVATVQREIKQQQRRLDSFVETDSAVLTLEERVMVADSRFQAYASAVGGMETYTDLCRVQGALEVFPELERLRGISEDKQTDDQKGRVIELEKEVGQRTFEDLLREDQELRVAAAKGILRREADLNPSQKVALQSARAAALSVEKEQILSKAFRPDETTTLMRSGLCDDPRVPFGSLPPKGEADVGTGTVPVPPESDIGKAAADQKIVGIDPATGKPKADADGGKTDVKK